MWSLHNRSSDPGTNGNDLPDEIKSRISTKTYHTSHPEVEIKSRISSRSTTSAIVPESDFGEMECGEPQRAQHLFFDFTPNTELDTPEVRDKVASFFEFLKTQTQLAQFCQMPEPEPAKEKKVRTKDTFESDFIEKPTAQKLLEKHPSCITQLTNKNIILKSYPLEGDDTISDMSESNDAHGAKKVVSKHAKVKKQKKLSALCKTLEDWDKDHLKSMDPPGPLLKHRPILQRRKPLDNAY